MSLSQWFGFNKIQEPDQLPSIFPLAVSPNVFVYTEVVAIYAKILTDVLERTHGLTDDQVEVMWDNCVKSNSGDGLITMLSKAMTDKRDLFLVYDKAINVVRIATLDEQRQIKDDYKREARSNIGVYISFQNFNRSDMVKLYAGLEHCSVDSFNKMMNLAKAVQLKFSDLRGSVSLTDSADVKVQAQGIARSLENGRAIMIDAKDSVETSAPDLTATKEAVTFITQKLSFYLGMPASYLSGEQTAGMGSSGENDMRAVERGLKAYYFSILKPVVEALFDIKVTYKSQDFRQILGSMEVLKTFSLIDDTLISAENKRKLVNALMDLPEDAEGDPAPKPLSLPSPAASVTSIAE